MVPRRLKAVRQAFGLSQEKLAELAGIEATNSRSQISNYEAGRVSPTFEFIVRLSKALDYPEAYFYTVDDVFAESLLQFHRKRDNPDFNPYAAELTEMKKLRDAAIHHSELLKKQVEESRHLSFALNDILNKQFELKDK